MLLLRIVTKNEIPIAWLPLILTKSKSNTHSFISKIIISVTPNFKALNLEVTTTTKQFNQATNLTPSHDICPNPKTIGEFSSHQPHLFTRHL